MTQQNPIPPPDLPHFMFWFNFVWILMIIALILGIRMAKVEIKKDDLSSKDYYLFSQFYFYRNGMEKDLQITKGEYLSAQAPPYLINGGVYGTLIERIIWCESKGDPMAQNPYSTAYGVCQFIDGTWDYVQEKWDMKLDRDSLYDQKYACKRLLREEGTSHWITTKSCWE